MKLLYTHENRLIVSNAKNIVEAAGITIMLKNEFAAGGVGELSAFDTWLELWVVDNSDFEPARDLIKASFSAENTAPWVCSSCKEDNDAAFEVCWNCQNEHQAISG